MKRWALVVVALYAVLFLVVTMPALTLIGGISWEPSDFFLGTGWFWFWLVLMLATQVLLLALPVRVASRRPVTRGALWPTILGAGFMLAILLLGAGLSIAEIIVNDAIVPVDAVLAGMLAVLVASWAVWSIIFYRMSRNGDSRDFISRLSRRLYIGSALELLIAVPSHVVARHRNYCCAGLDTGLGLCAGIAVMLLSFGPALYFLFIARWRRLHPKPPAP